MQESTSILRDFVERLMEHEGAAVERIGPDLIEYVAPPRLQEELGLAESGRLAFGVEAPEDAERITFESDWLERLGGLLGDHGRMERRVFPFMRPALTNPERVLEHGFVLQNAVHRFVGVRDAWTRYLIMYFEYSALSDEKRDGIVTLGYNLGTGSNIEETAADLAAASTDPDVNRKTEVPQILGLPAMWSAERIAQVMSHVLQDAVRRPLAPFLKSMDRRMTRDYERLWSYYNDLLQESAARLRKQPDEAERERMKQEAIKREYRAKIADLEQKYALKVDVRWLQTLDLIMPVLRFEILIKRRKGERRYFLDWNPIVRKLEPPLDEYGYGTEPGRVVCDEKLHLVSQYAARECPACGRPFCRACHEKKCPRCGAPVESLRSWNPNI